MKNLLTRLGFLLLAIPLILTALHNVSIAIWGVGFGEGRGGIAIPGMGIVTLPMAVIIPLPPEDLLKAQGVMGIEIDVRAPNSSIALYVVPLEALEPYVNVSNLVTSSNSILQYVSRYISLYDVLTGNVSNITDLLKTIEIVKHMFASLSRFKIAEGRDRLDFILSRTGNGNVCIAYAPNASSIDIDVAIRVRLVRYFDPRICTVSMASGAALLAIGCFLHYTMLRRVREVLR